MMTARDFATVGPMYNTWERLGDAVFRCRLPFLDVTVGLVCGSAGAMVIDTGSTRVEGAKIAADVDELTARTVSHVVLTHHHFDHVLGSSAFDGADVCAAPGVIEAMTNRTAELAADAVSYGADQAEVTAAVAALKAPEHIVIGRATVDLGGRCVRVEHLGRGHTADDLVVFVPAQSTEAPVVFCGDLVEESGEPAIDHHSDITAWPDTLDRLLELGGPAAVYVPGHGATVSAGFVAAQRDWLRSRR